MKTPNPKSFYARAERARYALKVLIEVMADDKRTREAMLSEIKQSTLAFEYLKGKAFDSHCHFSFVIGALRNYAEANGKKIKGV